MYRSFDEEPEKRLRTGDIVRLDLNDFRAILKNYELLEPLLKSYDLNPKYKSKLWAILNKPCDMVHDGTQRFKSSSLFLAPLQSFLGELRKDRIFAEYVLPPKTIEPIKDFLISLSKNYFYGEANRFFTCDPKASLEEKKSIKEQRTNFQDIHHAWILEEVLNFLDGNEAPDTTEEVFTLFSETEAVKGLPHIEGFLKNLPNETKWIDYKKNYEQTVKEMGEIHLNPKTINEMSKTIFVNQMEIRGRFYYEPHASLFSSEVNDFSYILELEDMITLKVSESAVSNGSLVDLLKEKRLVGLTRNYSDRLQNIMGYYYSKIGTADIQSKVVLALYDECFDHFFTK